MIVQGTQTEIRKVTVDTEPHIAYWALRKHWVKSLGLPENAQIASSGRQCDQGDCSEGDWFICQDVQSFRKISAIKRLREATVREREIWNAWELILAEVIMQPRSALYQQPA